MFRRRLIWGALRALIIITLFAIGGVVLYNIGWAQGSASTLAAAGETGAAATRHFRSFGHGFSALLSGIGLFFMLVFLFFIFSRLFWFGAWAIAGRPGRRYFKHWRGHHRHRHHGGGHHRRWHGHHRHRHHGGGPPWAWGEPDDDDEHPGGPPWAWGEPYDDEEHRGGPPRGHHKRRRQRGKPPGRPDIHAGDSEEMFV